LILGGVIPDHLAFDIIGGSARCVRGARMRRHQEIPAAAKLLGGAGALPFLLGAAGGWLLPSPWAELSLDALVFYGVVILSFLGAVHWGVALDDAAHADRLWRRLGWGVTPALIAWSAAMMTAVPALATLTLGIGLAYFVDLRARDRDELPGWYLELRRWLTAVATLSLGAALLKAV